MEDCQQETTKHPDSNLTETRLIQEQVKLETE